MATTWTHDRVSGRVGEQPAGTAFLADAGDDGRVRLLAVSGDSLGLADLADDGAGVRIEDLLPPEAAELAHDLWPRVRDGEVVRFETTARTPDGLRQLEIVAWLIGPGSTIAGVVHDRTDERQALRRLLERETLSRGLIDAMESATAVVGREGRIVAINAAWVRNAALHDAPVLSMAPGDDCLRTFGRHLPDVADRVRHVLAGGTGDSPQLDHGIGGRWWSFRVLPIDLDDERRAVVTVIDVTQRVRQEHALRTARDRWETAFEDAGTGMALVDLEGRFLRVNRRLCSILERPVEDLLGQPMTRFAHPDERDRIRERGEALRRDRSTATTERRFIRPDGSTGWLLATSSLIAADPGDEHIYVQYEDITARKLAEARLHDHRRLLELVASGAGTESVLLAVVETAERHLRGTRCGIAAGIDLGAPLLVTGPRLPADYAAEIADALSSVPWSALDDLLVTGQLIDDPRTAELASVAARHGIEGAWVAPVRDEDGRTVGVIGAHDRPEPPDDDQRAVLELLASVVGVTLARDRTHRRLARKSLEDPLTGLPNRALFVERLDQAIARLGRRTGGVAVIAVDLDRFSRVNHELGHRGGDAAIIEAGRRLTEAVPAPDTVARAAGDEFMVLCEDLDETAAVVIANRILDVLEQPFVIDGSEFRLTASAGVVHCDGSRSPADLEREATTALEVAKASGRSRLELFRSSMREAHRPKLALEQELRAALAGGQFEVHYQPETSLGDGRLVGFEALVRWRHPERGLLLPGAFIDAAEESGIIVDIGRVVIDHAVAAIARWSAGADDPLHVAVNLSARQLADPGLVDHVAETLQRHWLPAEQLMFEITESVLVDDAELILSVVRDLRDLGVRLAIDDFGTGYSTLLYLKRFPAHAVKIDRSFVDGLGTDPGDSAIVAAVVRLAHALDLDVIAEGVETPLQFAHLRQLGCETGQGFLWSRPVPPQQADDLVRDGLPAIEVPDIGAHASGGGGEG
jgi:diguanylate cyclase (GGDEF)-like protein/PAS domain S-box-containing protein